MLAAGVPVVLTGDKDVLSVLAGVYHLFPTPNPFPQPEALLDWRGNRCEISYPAIGKRFHLTVGKSSFRVAASLILLHQVLAELRPGLCLLHGNALIHEPTGRVLLLTGDSGAGKTTLTRCLIDSGAGWVLLAEDTLAIPLREGLIHPFPRSGSLKRPDRDPSQADAKAGWQSWECVWPEPASLQGASIVLLSHRMGAGQTPINAAGEEQPFTIWFSTPFAGPFQPSLFPGVEIRRAGERFGFGYLELPAKPSLALLGEIDRLARQEGAMILFQHAGDSSTDLMPERPANPSLETLKPSQGLTSLASVIRRPSQSAPSLPLGRVFIDLAASLRECSFWRFTPGGTPHRSARVLEDAVLGAGPVATL
ncbi:MAG: hypothetical protein RLY93_08025 [Sumerlaeia bacterium]